MQVSLVYRNTLQNACLQLHFVHGKSDALSKFCHFLLFYSIKIEYDVC